MRKHCQQWVHKTQDEDKQNRKKTNTENQKDEDNGQLSAHERLSVPASYQAFDMLLIQARRVWNHYTQANINSRKKA